MYCPFCRRDEQLEKRVFYNRGRWFAFLAAPYHTKGHAILAAKSQNEMGCPEGLKQEVLEGFDKALADVARVLQEYYQPKDILFASLRGDITHFHCHLIPRWETEETKWRQEQCYSAKGHLLEFLGHLEKIGDLRAETERKKQNLSDNAHRSKITEVLQEEVTALRRIMGWQKVL